MVAQIYYPVLDFIFGLALGLPPEMGEIVVAAVLTLVITLFYKYMVDQNKMKELKGKIKELQGKQKEIPKSNTDEMNKVFSEILALQNQQMKMNLKPMMVTLLLAVLFFPWMGSTFFGTQIVLPLSLPFIGNDLGWLMWYIVLSIPMSMIFRKLLGVNI